MDSVMVAGTVENAQSMIVMTAMAKADLAIIELDSGGTLEGLSVAAQLEPTPRRPQFSSTHRL
jgi:hypothetical protein